MMKEKIMQEITEEMIQERIIETKTYSIIIFTLFYIVPIFNIGVGSGYLIIFMLTPTICFIMSIFYGLEGKYPYFYIGLILMLYLPSTILYYNPVMILIGLGYTILAVMGRYVGETISLFTNQLYKKYIENTYTS